MAHIAKEGLSSITTGTAYIQEVKFLSPAPVGGKKQRSFFVVKLALHNGKRQDGTLAYIYPECGISDELKETVEQLQKRLEADADERIAAKVEISNLRGQSWFEAGKTGVNYRGTLRDIALQDKDAE